LSATKASQQLANSVTRDGDRSKLDTEATSWLTELCLIENKKCEVELEQPVSTELNSVYHNLSTTIFLDLHYLPSYYQEGLYIGGRAFPTRAAIAILILKAQSEKNLMVGPIFYCDKNYQVLATLDHGNVTAIEKVTASDKA
jgi:hypothetical protein